MYQGQLCKIIRRNHIDLPAGEDPAPNSWYLKLKANCEENPTKYFCIEAKKAIPERLVDDSMASKAPTRPYEVIYAASPEAQISLLNMRVNANQFAASLAAKERLENAKQDFEETKRKLTWYREALDVAFSRIKDEEITLERIKAGADSFMYVYAKHPGSETEFCWRVPRELEEYIHPGVVVKVQTNYGDKRVVVSSVVTHDFLLDYKFVLGVETCA